MPVSRNNASDFGNYFCREFLVDRLQYIGYISMDALIYSQLLGANETETFLLTAQNNCAILAWTLQTSLNKPPLTRKPRPRFFS